jgi:hypothetical protein
MTIICGAEERLHGCEIPLLGKRSVKDAAPYNSSDLGPK